MLRFSDSRNFSRTLAAIGLIAGPLLLCIESLLDPAWASDSAEYLAEVAADKGRYIAAGAAGTIGSLLFIPGLLGVMRLFRGRSVTLGQIAAGLLTVGVIGLTAILAFNGFDVILADHADRAAAVEIYDELDDSGALIAYFLFFFFIGIVLGSILLAIALFRRRIVPIWSPILLVVSILVSFFASEESAIVNAISFLILTAALAPLAMLIWGLSDDEWERWDLSLEDARTGGTAAPPPPRATHGAIERMSGFGPRKPAPRSPGTRPGWRGRAGGPRRGAGESSRAAGQARPAPAATSDGSRTRRDARRSAHRRSGRMRARRSSRVVRFG